MRGVPFTRTLRRELGRASFAGFAVRPRVPLRQALWPAARLGEAVVALGRSLGTAAPAGAGGPDVARAARAIGLDAKAIAVDHGRVEELVRLAGPALLRVEVDGETGYLALARPGRTWVAAVAPSGARVALRAAEVVAALRGPLERKAAAPFEGLLARLGADPGRRDAALRALVRDRVSAVSIAGGWLLERAVDAPLGRQLRDAGASGQLAAFGVVHALHAAAWIASWWLLGSAVLAGRPQLMLPWAVTVATLLPLRACAAALESRLKMGAGAVLKRRHLAGALAVAPDELRNVGVGTLVSRLSDAGTVESAGLAAGLSVVVAAIEGLVALGVLLAFGPALAAGLLGGAALLVLLRLRERARLAAWHAERRALTIDLVEKMLGHRTRRIQEAPELRHAGEREGLSRYLGASRRADTAATAAALVPRAWLVAAVAVIVLAWSRGAEPAVLAALAGAAWLGESVLEKLGRALGELVPSLVAARHLAPLLAARFPGAADVAPAPSGDGTLLELRDVSYRYPGRRRAVLEGVELALRAGDRLLIEGPSGSGKSTLAAILAGTRAPAEGEVVLDGISQRLMDGQERARLVASVPQFHENVIFDGTLKWNLLMGRAWPYDEDDTRDAEAICAELGLGELIARMPAGLEQMVGAYGWQLSHGEQTRIFLARAMLQGAKVLVFDEPFAALDPQSAERSVACLARRTESLVVISHR